MFAIRTPVFQTYIVKKTANYLSSELNTVVRIDKVYIKFFRTLSIKGLYIEDLQGDTLLYAGEISSVIDMFLPNENKIYLSGIDLKDAIFKLQKNKITPGTNLNFIIDYFTPETRDTSQSAPFDFNPGEVRLSNVEFVYIDNRYDDVDEGIDFEDIRVTGIDADLDNIRFESDGVYVNAEHISFTEKSGFRLEYLETNAKISSQSMEFENLVLKTPFTHLNGRLVFNYDTFSDFGDFLEKVRINSSFTQSVLSSKDLTFFTSELKGLDKEIKFDGKIKGTVAQLRGRDLNISFGKSSYFKGDMSIAGLPDFNESFFDLVVDELVTDKKDIESIPVYPFYKNIKMQLPDNISMLGKVIFKGKFTGFLNDFVAYGNASTAIGFISSDINLKIDKEVDRSSYSGHLSVIGFDVGALIGNSELLGKTSFKAKLSGSGLSLNNVNAKMDGLISSLELNNYEYSNINVDGEIAAKLFNGTLTISEKNIDLNFNGSINLAGKVPVYDFSTTIKNAYLAKLKLINRDTTSVLNTSAIIQLQGNNIDDLTGFMRLGATSYSEINNNIYIDSLRFNSETDFNKQKVTLRSGLIDFDLSGVYKNSKIIHEFEQLIKSYIPAMESSEKEDKEVLDIDYKLTFKNTTDLLSIFYPSLHISNGTTLSGNANNIMKGFEINLNSDSIKFHEILFSGLNINTGTSGTILNFNNHCDQIRISDTLLIYHAGLVGKTDKYKSDFSVAALAADSLQNSVTLKAEATHLNTGKTLVKLLPSSIKINNQNWFIDEMNTILIDSAFVDVNNVTFTSGIEKVSLNGVISSDKTDNLNLVLRNFNTEILNPLLAIYSFRMNGIASGSGDFKGILSYPGITSNMFIKDLGIYGDTLGDATIDFLFNTKEKIITASALVDKGGMKNIEVNGKYFILPVTDSLNFDVSLQKTNLTSFSNYVKGLASDIRGKISGKLKLAGPVNKLLLTGKANLQQTSFVVDYLNTRYNLSEEVEFNEKFFRFKNFTVNDENGNQANVDGYIYHKNLTDFSLKFDIRTKNFQMLNTNFSQNELFYGKAYGTGNVKIFGPLDLINITMGITTERNTQIYIPLSNPEEVSKINYINFVSSDQNIKSEVQTATKFTGIKMDFELDVTPDAEIQLIFDSKIGDVIKGRGEGDIKMEINTQGDFKMYGNYQVTSGDYLFTLQNLVNKKFIINPGGTIKWSGSPYEAEIDLEGVYKLKASLYDLVQDTALAKRIPVHVHLKLKDNLFNPTINFDIVIPDIDPTSQALVKRYISTEQEKSTQTMSLLVLNRFARAEGVEYQGTSSSGVGANAAELLSHQLTNWASQISDVVNVGVNYRAADAFSQEEIEVAVSTQLLNDRITIDGSVGVADDRRNTSGIIGDFTAEVKVSKDGKFRFKVFNKTINYNILNNYNSPYTQGIGLLFRQEFDSVSELFPKFRNFIKKEPEKVNPTP